MTTPVPAAPRGQSLALRTSLRRLAVRPRSLALLLAVPVLAVLAGIVGWLLDLRFGVDSAVYRAGAVTLLQGEPLYAANTLAAEPWWALLPFTYPPTAALLFTPLAVLPIQVAWGVLVAVSILSLALVVRVTIGALPAAALPAVSAGGTRWWSSPARATLIFTLLFLLLEPVWRTIFLGQINLILMALVVVDVLVVCAPGRSSRWGGVLVGVAAAVKLTPLIFVAHLLFTGRWRDALRALGTFVALQGLMFVIVPGDAARYWTHTLPDTGRIGPVHWAGNQSLTGLLNRLTDLAPWASNAAIGLGLLLGLPALWAVIRFHRKGQELAALLVSAFYMLLLSPISWSHHWVWAVPLIVLLVSRLPRTSPRAAWRRWTAAVAVVAVFASGVLLIMPNGRDIELHWRFWEFVIGSAYILVPVTLIAVLAVRSLLRRRRTDTEAGPRADATAAR
ncbi:hypothetical protein CFN78_02565 [Amycolatopsis antarctica]|uniref:Alpha-1,2-mannosyltransferase n=1 Tax=Amycolatopsis antarctica TaxID=1854586 RepID=A0A263DAR7_9PSEU|nr:glycosyltransferase 87 family protein [Amycolatopsis antarctica]OZM75078.1 hypothetical protein CFN78_02565 [Amycolatopsis antarctica]